MQEYLATLTVDGIERAYRVDAKTAQEAQAAVTAMIREEFGDQQVALIAGALALVAGSR